MLLKFGKFIFLILLFLALASFKEEQINVSNDIGHIHNVVEVNEKKDIKEKNSIKEKPLGYITISKINLNRPLYSINSILNNVNKNIEILKDSDMPDEEKGNFILASHSGHSAISYFRNLHKLSIGDKVTINYDSKNYIYEIADIYDVMKTGHVAIKRDKDKQTITMITCLGSDKQLVVIGYLI